MFSDEESIYLNGNTRVKGAAHGPEEDFENVARALVTSYAILLGDFETDYVFYTTNRTIKGIAFVFFQVVMSITMLNLLIAVMTQAYRTVRLSVFPVF